jgi:hypothetical protein
VHFSAALPLAFGCGFVAPGYAWPFLSRGTLPKNRKQVECYHEKKVLSLHAASIKNAF